MMELKTIQLTEVAKKCILVIHNILNGFGYKVEFESGTRSLDVIIRQSSSMAAYIKIERTCSGHKGENDATVER